MGEDIGMNCKIVSFEEVYDMTRAVYEKIKTSGYEPTTIVGIARGGWIPARLMCDFLAVTDLISLKVEHWLQTGETKDEAQIRYPLCADLSGKKVLIVDDITDTGKSLIVAVNHLIQFNPEEMRVATMQYIPGSEYRPDFFGKEVKEWAWFIYPWNWIEDTSTLIVRVMSTRIEEEWSEREISEELFENFGIKWNEGMLEVILKIMEERDQISVFEKRRGRVFKLLKSEVIQL